MGAIDSVTEWPDERPVGTDNGNLYGWGAMDIKSRTRQCSGAPRQSWK